MNYEGHFYAQQGKPLISIDENTLNKRQKKMLMLLSLIQSYKLTIKKVCDTYDCHQTRKTGTHRADFLLLKTPRSIRSENFSETGYSISDQIALKKRHLLHPLTTRLTEKVRQ